MKLKERKSSRVPRRSSDLWRRGKEGTYQVLSGSGSLVNLNASAFEIWQMADGSRSVDEITKLASERFGLSEVALRGDLEEALEAMERRKILVLDWQPLGLDST